MPVSTKQSLSGFVASTPALTRGEDGQARAYMRVGQPRAVPDGSGGFLDMEPEFVDLVMFRKTAERAVNLFQKGDRFISEGKMHTYSAPDPDGVVVDREEFVANKIGHDPAFTRYAVDRTPRTPAQAPTNTPTIQPVDQTAAAPAMSM